MTDLRIADLVAADAADEWLDYPEVPGFRVHLVSPDNPVRVRLATLAAKLPNLDDQNAQYRFLIVGQSVAGWEGLKVTALAKLFPGKKLNLNSNGAETPALDAELAYTSDNLEFLLRKSEPFYRWLNAQVNAREIQEEADRKNS